MSSATATPANDTKKPLRTGCFIVGQVIGETKIQSGQSKTPPHRPYKFAKFRVLAGDQIAEVSQSYTEAENPSMPAPGTLCVFQIQGDFKHHDMVVVKGRYEGPAA